METYKKQVIQYTPTLEVQEKRTKDYGYLSEMIALKIKPMAHFSGPDSGARSFLDNIDASEKIVNGYTLARSEQGKEEWQSNLLDNVSRAKLRGVAAGVGLKIPDMRFGAVNGNGIRSAYRAGVFKHITTQTFKKGNPTLENFQEVWQRIGHGVTFTYEGYHTGGAKQKIVESFDSLTGEVKYKEKYVTFSGCPVSILLNPQEFYWWDFFKDKIEEQQRLAWVQHYSKKQVEIEFSKYPNYKYVQDRSTTSNAGQQDTTYFKAWSTRVSSKNDYEVFRYYSLEDDCYRVYINGVLIVDAPMLWGEKRKYYPFAKTILEPYANTNFFVGMPFGQMVEAYQDGKNTILNTIIDKLYRSIKPRTLVGLQNKDLFDVQNDITEEDNFLYVPDVNAVRSEPIQGVTGAELNMLGVMDRGIESVSISSASQGIPQKNITATADQIAAARAAEIKSNLFIYSEDLWLQKTRLRVETILTHYVKDIAAQEYKKDQIIYVYDYSFGDNTKGLLGIHIAKSKRDLLTVQDIEAREQAAKQQGEVLKLISIPEDYLEDWECDFEVIPSSLHAQEAQKEEGELLQEINQIATLFPEFFVANREKYLRELLEAKGKSLDDYAPPAQPQPEQMVAAQAQQPQGTQAPIKPQPSVLNLPQ